MVTVFSSQFATSMTLFHVLFFFDWCIVNRDLHSFPTRRSSDLILSLCGAHASERPLDAQGRCHRPVLDRKSTRLNSSHGYISYAVFCLKKKTIVTQSESLR